MTNINLPPLTGEQDEDQWKTQVTNWANSGNLGGQGSNIDGDAVTYEDNGEILAGDILLGYQLRYLDTAYATNATGSDNFSDQIADLPADATVIYQGRRNSATPNKSNTPAAFTWVLINPVTDGDTPGDGLGAYYRTAGGRFLDWIFDTTQPTGYTLDDGASVIDLELFEGTPGPRGEQGVSGDDGSSVAVVNVFLRAAAQPEDPVGGSYDFSTNTLDAPSGWQASVPEGTDPLYTSQATASVQGSTGIDSDLFWSTAMIISENGANGTDGTDGTDGVGGVSTYAILVFRRSDVLPTTPNGGSYNFGNSTFTPPNNWQTNIPTGTDPIYASTAYAAAIGGGTDADLTWTSPVLFVQNGADGADATDGTDGNTSAQVSVYLRAATAPAQPTGGSYNFTTNTLSAPSGWFTSVPAGSEPVYSSSSIASIVGTEGTDTTLTWSSPVTLVANGADGVNGSDGSDGANGVSTYAILAFRRSSTLPTTPTGGSYDFATSTFVAPNNWQTNVPSGTDPIYASTAFASAIGEGTDSSLFWTSPVLFVQNGADGADATDGTDGNTAAQVSVYLRAAAAPAQPTGGSYNFTTNVLTAPTNWSTSVPAGSEPVFSSSAIASIIGTTGTDSSITWSSPVMLVANGSDGVNGTDGTDGIQGRYTVQLFKRDTTEPDTPTDVVWTEATDSLSGDNAEGWSLSIPDGADQLYITEAIYNPATNASGTLTTWSEVYASGATGPKGDQGDTGAAGSNGLSGMSLYEANVYQRGASTPSTPTGGSYNFTTNTLTPPNGWNVDVPDGTDPVYRTTALASIEGAEGIDAILIWSGPVKVFEDGTDGTDGDPGVDGLSTYQSQIYQRATSAPETPTGGSFNFGTNILTPPTGWSGEVPAGSDPIYATTGLFSIQGDTGIDNSVTWVTPTMFVQNGAAGADGNPGADGTNGLSGMSLYEANVYLRSTTTPAAPTGGSYNFTTNTLTPPSLWDGDVPAGTDPVYRTTALASIMGAEGIDSNLIWSAPVRVFQDGTDGTNGDPGADGLSTFQSQIFIRATTLPTTPTGGSFNFGTNILTPPTGWAGEVPAGTDPIYATTGLFSIIGDTGTDTSVVWVTPTMFVQNGTDGADGMNGTDGNNGSDGLNGRSYFEANIYVRANATPTQPTGGSYDFDTETLTPPTDWFIDVPTGPSPVYRSTGLFSVDGATGIDSDVTWSVPVFFVQDGTDGTAGADGNDGRSTFQAIIFQRSVSTPDTPAEDDGSFDFDNQILVPPSGWSITTPVTGTNPVYTSTGLFSILGDTGTDETVVWTAPALAFMNGNNGSDGTDGTDGSSSGTVLIYRRLTSTPATPADTVITVADLSFTVPDGWSKSIPAGSAQVWLTSATFNTPLATATLSWTEPEVVFQDGQDGSNGTNTAPLYAYKRSASTLADDNRPTTDVTYTFSTATVSNNNLGNGWTFDLPDGTDPLYTSVGVISSTTDTAFIDASSFWSAPQILGDTGDRGAGTWNHRVGTSLAVSYTQAELNAFLAEAIPGANNDSPINGDQLLLFSSVSITDLDVIDQAAYLFSGSAWINQSVTLNGKLIVKGSIRTAQLDIDETLTLTGPTSGFVGGRTGDSDFGVDGFYVGRTSTDGVTADGFQLSHTSITGTNHPQLDDGILQAVIHDDSEGLRIYEPIFYQRDPTSAIDTENSLTVEGQTATLVKGEIHTVSLVGGGGGGGAGADSLTGGANSGGAGGTTVVTLTGATGFTGIRTASAAGGFGGPSGTGIAGFNQDGLMGGQSAFGDGGIGGDAIYLPWVEDQRTFGKPGSAPASTSYGAGGGGGSGGIHEARNGAGGPGIGGGASTLVTITFDLSTATTDGILTLTSLGAAGAMGTPNTSLSDDNTPGGNGGVGAVGVAVITGVLDGYAPYTLDDLINGGFSERKLKRNIRLINDPIQRVSELNGYRFNYKSDNRPDIGLLVEDVELHFPEVIDSRASNKRIRYAPIIALLTEAIKAQQSIIDTQQTAIDNFEDRITALETHVKTMEI